MDTVTEIRFWINRMNDLNESLKDQEVNKDVEVKEFKPNESNWDYCRRFLICLL